MLNFRTHFTGHHPKLYFKALQLLFFIGLSVSSYAKTDFSRDMSIVLKSKNMSLKSSFSVDGCTLFNPKGKVELKLQGYLCQKAGDVGYISVTGDYSSPEFSLFDKKDRLKWKKGIPAHHLLTFEHNMIYVASHQFKNIGGRKIRLDTFKVFDLEGNQKWFWSSEDILTGKETILGNLKLRRQNKIEGGYYEYTHINSYLVHQKNPAIIIASLPHYGSLIQINMGTGKSEIIKKYPNLTGIHSIIRRDGYIFFFANQLLTGQGKGNSAIIQANKRGDILKVWDKFDSRRIFSKTRGSISISENGVFLISLSSGEFFEFDPKSDKILSEGRVVISGAHHGFLEKIYSMEYLHE